MPNLGNKIKFLKIIFGLNSGLQSNLSELKKREEQIKEKDM